MSIRDQLKQRRVKNVVMPSGETVVVRSLTSAERLEINALAGGKDYAFLLAHTAVKATKNEDGTQTFTVDDVPDLMEEGGILQFLTPVIIEVSGLAPADVEDAKKN